MCLLKKPIKKTCPRTSEIKAPILCPLAKTLVHLDPTKHKCPWGKERGRRDTPSRRAAIFSSERTLRHWATDHILRAGSLVFEIHMTLKDSLDLRQGQSSASMMKLQEMDAFQKGKLDNRYHDLGLFLINYMII